MGTCISGSLFSNILRQVVGAADAALFSKSSPFGWKNVSPAIDVIALQNGADFAMRCVFYLLTGMALILFTLCCGTPRSISLFPIVSSSSSPPQDPNASKELAESVVL